MPKATAPKLETLSVLKPNITQSLNSYYQTVQVRKMEGFRSQYCTLTGFWYVTPHYLSTSTLGLASTTAARPTQVQVVVQDTGCPQLAESFLMTVFKFRMYRAI